jgi:hypothetical protein
MSNDIFSKTDGRTRYKYMFLTFFKDEMHANLNYHGEYGWNVVSVVRFLDGMGAEKFNVTLQLPYWLGQEEIEENIDSNE